MKEMATAFAEFYGADYDRPITPKRVGMMLRRKLGLLPQKTHGEFVAPLGDRERFYEKYGIDETS